MATQAPHPPVCLLSLDGGGIKGISELLILQHIMVAVQGQLGLAEEPLPCDYFDLVGGTSTGGLIAIMLVRLRMTASEALRQYFELAGEIFSKKNTKTKGKEGAFKASTLEASVREIVVDHEKKHSGGASMLPSGDNKTRAKGFVCAMAAEMMKKPYHLRTYKVPGEILYDCEIWEAARATTAAPTYFKAISIKWPNGSSNRFVDAGLGFNNPTEEIIEEGETIFGSSTPLRVLVSLGCGVKSSIRYDAPSVIDKFLPLNAIKTVQAIATDCEKTSQKLERSFKNHTNVYFRFNIPEIGDIGLSEVDEATLDRISASTKAYFDVGSAGHTMLGPVVKLLCEGVQGTVPMHDITVGKILTLGVPSKRGHQNLPFQRNTNFVGRESYLKQLATKLDPRIFAGTCPWVALDGLGGIGKTQIALQFAYQIQELSPECSVFWVQASDATSFDTTYREIAHKLGIPGIEDDKTNVKQLVFTALRSLISPWLLIVDNVNDYKVLNNANEGDSSRALVEYLPNRGNGAVLFSTRDHKAASDLAKVNVIHVKEMNRQESIKLLKTSVQVQKHNLLDDMASINALLDLLLDLPLAIKQAAAYMNKNTTPIAQYLSSYNNSEEEMIEILNEGFEDRGRYRGQKSPVATTWFISFEQIRRDDSLAAEYLSFMSVIARDDIPRSLLLPGTTPNQQTKAIGTLTAYSFVIQRLTEDAFDVHRLVHLATRNWLAEKNKQSIWADRALHRLVEVIPAGGHTNRQVWTRYLPHGIYLADTIKVCTDNEMEVIELRDRIGRCQYDVGQYIGAEKTHQRTLALLENVLGKEHPKTLSSRSQLGEALRSQGKCAKAEEIFLQTLASMEKVLGKEHPNTLASMNNLGLALSMQGKYTEALEIFSQTLASMEKVLGKEHPNTLMTKNNVGHVFSSQGKYTMAEGIHRETLVLGQRILGTEHPSTLMNRHNLGATLNEQGKYAEAEEIGRETLALMEKVFGNEHPHTLTSRNNLGDALSNQKKYTEAEEIIRETIVLSESALGKEHTLTFTSMNNLGQVFSGQEKYTESEEIHRETLVLMEKTLGKEHPSTLMNKDNLGEALYDQEKYIEAEDIYRETLALRESVLGMEHCDTLTSKNNLGKALYSQGKYAEAEEMHRETLALRQKVLGKEHDLTQASMIQFGMALYQQDKYADAEEIYRETLALSEKVLGKEAPTSLTIKSMLGRILSSQEQYAEAEEIQWETLALRKKVLGKEHTLTLSSMNDLGEALSRQKKHAKAEEMFQETLALMEKVLGSEHPDTITIKKRLRHSFRKQGKHNKVEEMYRGTLGQKEKLLGKDHPDTLIVRSKLGEALIKQKKYIAAREMHQETLVLREKVLGKEHPDTLISANNLGDALYSQGRYAEAEEIYRETLVLREKVLGRRHSDTLASRNNLGLVLRKQKRYAEAEVIYRETVVLRDEVLGKEHPDTLASKTNLAEVLSRQKKYAETEELHRELLEVREKVLGKEHRDTLTSMSNVAQTMSKQKKYAEAVEIYLEMLELMEKVLGEDHPNTLAGRKNLQHALNSQGSHTN